MDQSGRAQQIPEDRGSVQAWMKLSTHVLEAIANHAVHCNDAEYEEFRRRVAKSAAGLHSQLDPSDVLTLAGSLWETIEGYFRGTQRTIDSLLSELRAISRLLLSSLAEMYVETGESAQYLAEAQEAIGSAAVPETLIAVKSKLAAHLDLLPRQPAAIRKQAADPGADPQERIRAVEPSAGLTPDPPAHPPGQPRPAPGPAEDFDSRTGLPAREAAVTALERVVSGASRTYAVVLYVHRLKALNARFGDKLGDEVLLLCSQRLATHLIRPNDQLFRWRGPAFVALLEREESLIAVNEEVQRFTAAPMTEYVKTSSRTLLLPIKVAGEAMETNGRTGEELVEGIENWILHVSDFPLQS